MRFDRERYSCKLDAERTLHYLGTPLAVILEVKRLGKLASNRCAGRTLDISTMCDRRGCHVRNFQRFEEKHDVESTSRWISYYGETGGKKIDGHAYEERLLDDRHTKATIRPARRK